MIVMAWNCLGAGAAARTAGARRGRSSSPDIAFCWCRRASSKRGRSRGSTRPPSISSASSPALQRKVAPPRGRLPAGRWRRGPARRRPRAAGAPRGRPAARAEVRAQWIAASEAEMAPEPAFSASPRTLSISRWSSESPWVVGSASGEGVAALTAGAEGDAVDRFGGGVEQGRHLPELEPRRLGDGQEGERFAAAPAAVFRAEIAHRGAAVGQDLDLGVAARDAAAGDRHVAAGLRADQVFAGGEVEAADGARAFTLDLEKVAHRFIVVREDPQEILAAPRAADPIVQRDSSRQAAVEGLALRIHVVSISDRPRAERGPPRSLDFAAHRARLRRGPLVIGEPKQPGKPAQPWACCRGLRIPARPTAISSCGPRWRPSSPPTASRSRSSRCPAASPATAMPAERGGRRGATRAMPPPKADPGAGRPQPAAAPPGQRLCESGLLQPTVPSEERRAATREPPGCPARSFR